MLPKAISLKKKSSSMFQTSKQIIVASGSPRGQQFFTNLGIAFQVLNVQNNELYKAQDKDIPRQGIKGAFDKEERPAGNENPEEYAKRAVLLKAFDALRYLGLLQEKQAFLSSAEKSIFLQALSFPVETFSFFLPNYEKSIIVTADTIVCLGKEILGKPKTEEEALTMLKKLQGKTHVVMTAVSFVDTAQHACYLFCDKTEVTFMPWADDILKAYVKTGESFDKAGAYGISGQGSFLARSVQGNLDTVIGLPVAKCVEFLLWNKAITI